MHREDEFDLRVPVAQRRAATPASLIETQAEMHEAFLRARAAHIGDSPSEYFGALARSLTWGVRDGALWVQLDPLSPPMPLIDALRSQLLY